MGLFDWLSRKRSKVDVAKHQIWLTHEAKYAGICKDVAQALADPAGPSAVVVVAHFNDCLDRLRTILAGFDQNRVLLVRADALGSRTPTDLITDESNHILIIVGERHPLLSHDETVLDFAQSQPYRCRVVYHLSLEDPLLKRFAGEWVQQILRKLGMKEDEAIQSHMVSRRIQTELKKISRSVTNDSPADSAEEWLEHNYAK